MTGNKSCFVLEAGEYRFYVGEDCRRTKELCGAEGGVLFAPQELLVTERLQEAAAPVKAFCRIKPVLQADGSYAPAYEAVPLRTMSATAGLLWRRLPRSFPWRSWRCLCGARACAMQG